MKSLFISLLVAFVSGNLQTEPMTKEFDAGKIEFLDIRNTSGKIAIKGTDAEKASVTAEKIKVSPNCEIEIEHKDVTLMIDIHDRSWIRKDDCVVDLEVSVPKKVSMNIKSGSGKISISGTEGKIDFLTASSNVDISAHSPELTGRLASGNLTVDGTLGNIELESASGNMKINGTLGKSSIRSSSGNIELQGLSENAHIFTASGNIVVKYPKTFSAAELSIKSGSGNTTIHLPADSKITTDFSAGSGRLFNEVGDTEDPTLKIAFRSGSGDLKIKKTK